MSILQNTLITEVGDSGVEEESGIHFDVVSDFKVLLDGEAFHVPENVCVGRPGYCDSTDGRHDLQPHVFSLCKRHACTVWSGTAAKELCTLPVDQPRVNSEPFALYII